MIPELSAMDADTIAERYSFSGGQIENIARKYTVFSILHGETGCPQSAIIELCNNEKIAANNSRKIGF